MQQRRNWNSLRVVAASCTAAILAVAYPQAFPQASESASIQLQPYTAPDGSASVGVPSGWKVTSGSEAVIVMSGPEDAAITLGKTFIARNAPFQAGQKGAGGTDLSMPYTAPLTQKLIMVFEQDAAVSGKPAPQITFSSATPLQLPPVLGQCGRFVASASGSTPQPEKLMGAFCSLPLDSGGIFKNIILLAQAPDSVAAQDAPIASAVFSSYKIPPAMLAKKLAPVNAPPPARPGVAMPGAMPGVSAANNAAAGADVSSTCFDLGVIRALPPRQLPQECGGEAPNP